MSKIRWLVIIIGLLVIVAQAVELGFNGVLSDWENAKDAMYTDYERYLDFETEALVIRGAYNTLQAVNNSDLHEVILEREKEFLDRRLASLLALIVHFDVTNKIEVDNKSEWFEMNYTELDNLARELDPLINEEYSNRIDAVNAWKLNVNIASAVKFSLLAVEVILVNFDKTKK